MERGKKKYIYTIIIIIAAVGGEKGPGGVFSDFHYVAGPPPLHAQGLAFHVFCERERGAPPWIGSYAPRDASPQVSRESSLLHSYRCAVRLQQRVTRRTADKKKKQQNIVSSSSLISHLTTVFFLTLSRQSSQNGQVSRLRFVYTTTEEFTG